MTHSTQTHIGVALLAASFLLPPSSALAEDEDEPTWGWNAFAGVRGFDEKSQLGDGRASSISNSAQIGFRLWQRFGSLTALEAELPMGVTTSRDQVATLFVTMPRVHGRLSPLPEATVSPSLVVGGGVPIVTSTKRSSVPSDILGGLYAGAGVKLKLKGLYLGIEGRYISMPATGDPLLAHEWELLLSFGLRAKKTKKHISIAEKSDRDRDGIFDDVDQCPNRREDMDDFEDADGCPELDNDLDGVIDGLDECQGKAETFNGFEDGDGCPDEVTDDVRLLVGVISGLRFEAGSGVMDDDSVAELDRLVGVLKARPSIKVDLYGHADAREAEGEALEELGQERADSVRQYFIEAGVGHGRITAFSRGDTEPFADNSTASGRRANRRVEIQIHERDSDAE